MIVPEVSPQDDRSYGIYTTSCGLNCLLISDPTTDKASAAMDVRVGQFNDPDHLPGKLYWINNAEHKTKKYPNKFLHVLFPFPSPPLPSLQLFSFWILQVWVSISIHVCMFVFFIFLSPSYPQELNAFFFFDISMVRKYSAFLGTYAFHGNRKGILGKVEKLIFSFRAFLSFTFLFLYFLPF
jgi:hypothetical protein